MRAIRFTATGGPDVLDLVELPDPRPGPGQILVRQVAIGVNYIDTYHRSGLYPLKLPSGLGMEGAGEVLATGEGVERFAQGDRVAFASGPIGAYAELHLVDAGRAVRITLARWPGGEPSSTGRSPSSSPATLKSSTPAPRPSWSEIAASPSARPGRLTSRNSIAS
jgi:NADPH:quinone reductase-like Zn-dependent oxidoreductase